jgi:multidrug efflux system membrane fusion protein
VQRGAPGTYVYVVNADQTVSVRKVTLGPGDAANISITQGLAAGETVVVDGADKLKDGARVLLRQGVGGGGGAAAGQAPGTGQHPHRRQQQNNQSGSGGG